MFTASSLLLLTLMLNVQLCSPAPIPAVGEVTPSPEASPTKEGFANIAEVPVLNGDLKISADPDEDVSQEAAPRELLVAAPQESAGDDAAFADTSPEDTKVDAPDQHRVEDPVQIAPVPVIPLDTSHDGAPEVEEEAAPGQMLLIVQDDNAEVEPDASQETPPEAPEEENSVVFVPSETEIQETDQDKSVAEKTTSEEPAFIVLEEPAEQEPDTEKQGETVHIVPSDTKEGEEEEYAFAPIVQEENTEEDPATEEPEEESVVLLPGQLEDQVEPAAEETAPQEPEDPAVILPMDLSEGEAKQEEQAAEETISLVPLVKQEKVESPEGNTEAESPVTAVPADAETNEEGQEETAMQVSAPGFADLIEPTSEEPDPEDLILIIPLEDLDEEVSEDYTEEVQSDPLPQEPTLEDDDSDPYILIVSVTETPSETETSVLHPVEKVSVAATEILTEASVESVTYPAPAATDAEVETFPPSVEGVNVTGVTTHSDDFKAAGVLTEDESAALANRGAVLGATFFTLVSFIIIGLVGAIVSKKLRRLHDTEVKII